MEAIFLACGAGGPQLKRDPLGCSFTYWTGATTTLARLLLALIAVGLVAAGVLLLYDVIGTWGFDRDSAFSWKLALLGVLGVAVGAVLLFRATRSRRPSSP